MGKLITLPAEKINASRIQDADVLLVRSVTPITPTLLSGTSIGFIGSATAGIDHINTTYLNEAGIFWAYAPGCNAKAVVDYVLLSVACLIQAGTLTTTNRRAGVIGMGHVGQQVASMLKKIHFDVLYNDPPREANESNFTSTSLDQFYDLDLICLHTPLTDSGDYPTQHLIDETFLSLLNPRCVLLNAGRGACIQTHALKQFQFTTIMDVWESEPNIDIALAQSAFIATPHIAGYSQPAKYNATKQIFDALCYHFDRTHKRAQKPDPLNYVTLNLKKSDWTEHALGIENLKLLSEGFQKAIKENTSDIATLFQQYRKAYPFRMEFHY